MSATAIIKLATHVSETFICIDSGYSQISLEVHERDALSADISLTPEQGEAIARELLSRVAKIRELRTAGGRREKHTGPAFNHPFGRARSGDRNNRPRARSVIKKVRDKR